MLLQKLHRDESLAIGSDIRVVVIAVNPDTYRVTLGIEAPRELAISRESSCSKTSENPVGKNNLPSGVILSDVAALRAGFAKGDATGGPQPESQRGSPCRNARHDHRICR